MFPIDIRQIGILLVIVGTILLAKAIKPENKYTLSARSDDEYKREGDIVKRAEDGTYFEPSIVIIDNRFYHAGLACVAIGSLFQW